MSRKYCLLVVAMLVFASASAFAVGTIDYDNLITSTGGPTWGTGAYWSGSFYAKVTDVHRESSNPLTAIEFYAHSNGATGTSAKLYIFANVDEDPSGMPLAVYTDIALPYAPSWNSPAGLVHFDLPTPLAAPADLWIGIRMTLDGGQGVYFSSQGVAPVVGVNHLLQRSYYGAQYAEWGFGEEYMDLAYSNDANAGEVVALRTFSAPIPEPGSLLALGSGLVGLLGLGLRRRR